MNTSAFKTFAQTSRRILRESVTRRLIYWGFDTKGNVSESVEALRGGYTFRGMVSDDSTVPAKWNKLKSAIKDTSFDEVLEKASYTWFNRMVAMKILSKNGYETAQLDYLNEETNTPAILERARRGQYSFLNNNEQLRLKAILTDYQKEQDAFAILLIGYCHQHPLLQGIFGTIDDYTELLLPDDVLTENGFLYFLNTNDAISDEDYKQVELIGWLYQFYISEKKDEVFAGFKKNKKAEAKDIPAATQIFTPNWIVKYMVQNTLGRTWLDAHPESELKEQWKYLVEPGNGKEESTNTNSSTDLDLATLNFLDPAVGSGHILVEAFDTLYPMYMAEFYSTEEAVKSILQKNLFGLDLDNRAAQLAQFALIIKAAQYSRTVLEGKLLPHVYSMPQPRVFSKDEVKIFLGEENEPYFNQLFKVFQTMEQANNLGSMMVLELSNEAREIVIERNHYWQTKQASILEEEIIKEVFPTYVPIVEILTNRFSCIAANPPYMGQKNMNAGLKNYVNLHYPLTKSDLFAVFMDVCNHLLQKGGRYGMINMQSWMFLSSYEKLREHILSTLTIESMLHLGPRTFDELSGEVVQNTTFIISKANSKLKRGTYFRLIEYKDSESKNIAFLATANKYSGISQAGFKKIPGKPIAYWVTEKRFKTFEAKVTFNDIVFADGQNKTGDNETYVRFVWEPSKIKIGINRDYVFYAKGGQFRKWSGNNEIIVKWDEISRRHYHSDLVARIIKEKYWFRRGFTFSRLANIVNGRILDQRGSFDATTVSFFLNEEAYSNYFNYVLAFFNSVVGDSYIKILNPTLVFQLYDVRNIPFLVNEKFKKNIDINVDHSVYLSKLDWDSREASWDFQTNPLIIIREENLEKSYHQWLQRVSNQFFQLHANEEELNCIFIDIYGLQEELVLNVPLKNITILQEELDYNALEKMQKPFEGKIVPVHADVVMQQLISYAIGCYLGRFRLDKPGLHIAHPNPSEEELLPYSVKTGEDTFFQFQIDDDAIIPLMGSNGNFTDDMLHRVKEFLSIVWGNDTLTANLNFLQQNLGKDLEDYLVKDFWQYHTRMYSKKPIYWLFSSKKGAFQVLVYMHRMNAYTSAKIRSKYLIPHISWLQNVIRDFEKDAANLSKTELKKLDILRKQLTECEEYDLVLKDFADKQISFDLDDGVTKNYALFEGVVQGVK